MKTKKQNIENYTFGKLQPQALELEEAVLGAILIDKGAIVEVMDVLTTESFYSEAHKKIFKACLELDNSSQPIDLLTATERLKKNEDLEEVGGAYYLVELTNKVASSANIEAHARVISQKFIQREVIRVSCESIKTSYEDSTDAFELLSSFERDVLMIGKDVFSKSANHVRDCGMEILEKYEISSNSKDGVIGLSTGISAIDEFSSGLQAPDLTIIAARPGMGKTTLALNIANNVANNGHPVAFFSLEMSTMQLTSKIVCMRKGLDSTKLKKGKLEPHEVEKLNHGVNELDELPIYIDDTAGLSTLEFKSKAQRLKSKKGIKLIIVDYIQLMTDKKKGQNREQEVSSISRTLKLVAKELGVPVMALSQLNRSVETRGSSKRPQLSDLRESGAIEQDADIVNFLYRPEYYDIMEDVDGNSTIGKTEFIYAKHRGGALDTINLMMEKEHSKFKGYSERSFEDYNKTTSSNLSSIPKTEFIPEETESNLIPKDDLPF